jgi:spermidine/putrescine-binding protein
MPINLNSYRETLIDAIGRNDKVRPTAALEILDRLELALDANKEAYAIIEGDKKTIAELMDELDKIRTALSWYKGTDAA